MTLHDAVVIVGAGQAGAAAATALRRHGHAGPITLIGAETDPPYERPDLSKAYLAGSQGFDRLVALTPEAARQAEIDLRLSDPVTGIDLHAGRVETTQDRLPFDHLILATGGQARSLAPDIPTLRSRADADGLRDRLAAAGRLTVIGGGWLGLEVASTARAQGLEVTVLEAAERLCARVVPAIVSDALLALHREAGVTVRLSHQPDLAALRSDPGLLVACVGMVPTTELAEATGLTVEGGVLVDVRQRASAERVYAIGDCARHHDRPRIESWAYANASADRAARAILGLPADDDAPLWFWSKQHGVHIQMIGLCDDRHRCVIRRGKGTSYAFLDGSRLAGLIAFDAPRDLGMARALVARGAAVDPDALADPSVPIARCALGR